MVNATLLEELAARVLDVPPDADEDEVSAAFRDKSSDWHPDISDAPDAQQRFIAAQTARDVLLGNIDFSDFDKSRTAKSSLSHLFDESEVAELSESTKDRASYQSTAEARGNPESYTQADIAGATPDEKREMMKEIALGVETVIVYQSVEGLYERGYDEGQFFSDINDYIGEASKDRIDFSDYYEATKDSLREQVNEELFIDSCGKIQENLQSEYGEGTNIREVSRIVAHFMVQGGIDLGHFGRFVGGRRSGGDDRFTRDHPLGGHGRGRRSDPRYTRGDDRFSR